MKKFAFFLLLPFVNRVFSQNVGIGIPNPTKAKLEVYGAVGITSAIFGGDGAGISILRNSPTIGFNAYITDVPRVMAAGGGWFQYLSTTSGSLIFDQVIHAAQPNTQSSLVRRLTVRQNGNVSINAAEANATLYVGGSNVGLPAAIFRGTSYNSIFYEQAGVNLPGRNTYINAGKNGSTVLLNDKLGGNVIIGYTGGTVKVGINTVPTDVLEVKQNGRGLALINPSFYYWEFYVEKNLTENASDMYVYQQGGNVGNFYNGDGLYYSYSDQRVKTNIEPIGPTLTWVMALRPKQYQMKYDNPGHVKSLGLIAQEIRPFFPEITGHVTSEELGYPGLSDLYTINYDGLGTIAIKAIQEQQQKIALLQSQTAALRQRVEAAEKALTIQQ